MEISRRNVLVGMAGLPAVVAGLSPVSAWAQDGKTLRVAIAAPAGDINPHDYNGNRAVMSLIYEPLIRYGVGGKFEPALAEKWEVENDGRHIRFHLRKNVTFQDGTPWDATALTWNFDRWIGKEEAVWLNFSAQFEKHNTIDDHTVELVFKNQVVGLLNEISYMRPVRFLSPKGVDANGKYAKPIGTGPWIEESADNTGSVFKLYDGYWGEKPAFDRIEVKVLPDSRGRVDALRAGEIDIIGGDFIAPIKAIEAETLKGSGVAVISDDGTTTVILGFNRDRHPALKERAVRQAINIGFDRLAIAQVLFRGLAKPAGSLFSEKVPMHGTRFPVPTRDPEAAKKLLEEAGWTGEGVRQKDGVKLAIEMVASEERLAGARAMAEILQAQLADIGIEMTIRSVDHAAHHSAIPKGDYDIAMFLNPGAPYEPIGVMSGAMLSTYNNGLDGHIVKDPEHLDPLINAVLAASDGELQVKAQAVYDWLHEEVAMAPVVYLPVIWAHSDRIQGFTLPATEYDLPYQGLSLKA